MIAIEHPEFADALPARDLRNVTPIIEQPNAAFYELAERLTGVIRNSAMAGICVVLASWAPEFGLAAACFFVLSARRMIDAFEPQKNV